MVLTVGEAALASKRHQETIRDALRTGDLHGGQRGKGGNWRIQDGCLDAWLLGESCAHATARKVAA